MKYSGTRRVQIGYAVAVLTALYLVWFSEHFVRQELLVHRQTLATVELGGRERMLSQTLPLLALKWQQQRGNEYRKAFVDLLALWSRERAKLRAQGTTDAAVLLSKTDPQFKAVRAASFQLADDTPGLETFSLQAERLEQASTAFLHSVQAGLDNLEEVADKRAQAFQQLCWNLTFTTVLVLGLACFKLFVPTLRRLHQGESLASELDCKLRLLSSAVQHSGSGYLITGADQSVAFVNRAFEETTGYRSTDLLGHNSAAVFERLAASSDAGKPLCAAVQNLQPAQVQLVAAHPSGKLYWIEVALSPVIDKDGVCTHSVAICHDISVQKAQEESLLAARSDAEIRSPVTELLERVNLIATGPLPDEQRELAAAIRCSGELLLASITRFLEFAPVLPDATKCDTFRDSLETRQVR